MAIKLTETIRHNGIRYPIGTVTDEIKDEDAKRLVKLGVAFYVKEIPVEEPEEPESPEAKNRDLRKEIDERFNAGELKEVALDLGIEFQSNISKTNLLDLIMKLEKAEEALEFEFVEED